MALRFWYNRHHYHIIVIVVVYDIMNDYPMVVNA